MPYKPLKPCSIPMCPNLTDKRYCRYHQREKDREYENTKRDPEQYKRYGAQWKKIRENFLIDHPFCEHCKSYGRLVKAQVVHHIIPLTAGGTHDEENLMSLCSSCHSRHHAKDPLKWIRK